MRTETEAADYDAYLRRIIAGQAHGCTAEEYFNAYMLSWSEGTQMPEKRELEPPVVEPEEPPAAPPAVLPRPRPVTTVQQSRERFKARFKVLNDSGRGREVATK